MTNRTIIALILAKINHLQGFTNTIVTGVVEDGNYACIMDRAAKSQYIVNKMLKILVERYKLTPTITVSNTGLLMYGVEDSEHNALTYYDLNDEEFAAYIKGHAIILRGHC